MAWGDASDMGCRVGRDANIQDSADVSHCGTGDVPIESTKRNSEASTQGVADDNV